MFHALILAAVTSTNAQLAATLASAIANQASAIRADVYVGALPPGPAPDLPLPHGTLVGSVVERDASGDTTVSALVGSSVEYFYELDAAGMTSYKARLENEGWRASALFAKVLKKLSPSGGGFAVQPPAVEKPTAFCSKDQRESIEVQRLNEPSSVIEIETMHGFAAMGMCALAPAISALSPVVSPPPLPLLNAPLATTMHKTGALPFQLGGSSAIINSTAPLPEIGASFAKQIVAAGWRADAPAQGPTAYAQTFHELYHGHNFELVLTLIGSGKPGTFDGEMRAHDVDAPPSILPF